MTEAVRRAYLRAMDIDVWIRRQQPVSAAEPILLGVGAGSGSTVLVCATPGDSATPLGRDLDRAIQALQGQAPVWAWLDPTPDQESLTLAELIDRQLVTRVLVLGAGLGDRLVGGQLPDAVGSAAVIGLPGLGELGSSASARRRAWTLLREGLRGTCPGGRA